jgi:hypothetical protein
VLVAFDWCRSGVGWFDVPGSVGVSGDVVGIVGGATVGAVTVVAATVLL